MQKKSFYFLLIFFSICFASNVQANLTQQLVTADSLFKQKKYTESFDIYEQLLEEDKHASSQMLLKMAFIKEGLGDYSRALYYLNLYYLKTSDKQVRIKMKDIAEEHNLSGFVINDSDFFLNLLNRYQLFLIIAVFFISAILFSLILYDKFAKKINPIALAIVFLAVQGLLFYYINFNDTNSQAIIVENHTYLMSGPSSGADLVEVVKKGHRVKTYAEHGPWLEILWNGKRVYIKKNKVRKLG